MIQLIAEPKQSHRIAIKDAIRLCRMKRTEAILNINGVKLEINRTSSVDVKERVYNKLKPFYTK